jgi:signal transduction histidine kinase
LIRDVTRERIIDESKSEFISIAAHQLRTPLSGMKWAISLILGGEAGEITETQKNLLQKSYETNENLIKIVNDLLNVSKIEDRRFGYEFKDDDIIGIVSKSVEAARVLTQDKPLQISFKAPSFIKPFPFDAAKIAIVMQNLLENAIDYTPEGGSVEVTITTENGRAKVTVKDTGMGIKKEDQGRIFTKFFRSEQAIRTKTDKSGLGLFIVKNIISQHRGDVSIDSEERRGTTISFTLPMNAQLESAQ